MHGGGVDRGQRGVREGCPLTFVRVALATGRLSSSSRETTRGRIARATDRSRDYFCVGMGDYFHVPYI